MYKLHTYIMQFIPIKTELLLMEGRNFPL